MNRFSIYIAVFVAALCLSACATGAVVIPQDLSPAEIIQRAQEASDRNRYNVARQYYEALLERNPDNAELVCTAEYEIAFIHYKQKQYPEAKEKFNALLERYDAPGGDALPPAFKLLSQKVLEQITIKENQRKPFSK